MSEQDINTDSTPKKRPRSKKELFLDSFSENANVMLSARAAGIDRSTVYKWLEHDETFSLAFNQAKENAKDVLRAEIYRRSVEGWDEDVYQLAKFAGTVRKYDTTLLIFHAKMMMPEYRDKQTVDVNANVTGSVQTSDLSNDLRLLNDEQLAQFKTWLLAAKTKEAQ
jgi:hypothetical protein